MVRLIFRRGLLRDFTEGTGGFAAFSLAEERCFLGETIGSVLTGSAMVSIDLTTALLKTYCFQGWVSPVRMA